jgi:hypothetical protein
MYPAALELDLFDLGLSPAPLCRGLSSGLACFSPRQSLQWEPASPRAPDWDLERIFAGGCCENHGPDPAAVAHAVAQPEPEHDKVITTNWATNWDETQRNVTAKHAHRGAISVRNTAAFKRPLASSRGGGRKPAQATEATREISVFTVGGRAQWQLTQGYAAKVDVIRAHLGTSVVGGGHPVLGIDTISLADDEYEELVTKVFGHVQHPVKEFRKLLCELGMRASGSTSKTGARTLTFDIDGWNQNGYRLTSQGRRRGPKPRINYIPAACVETDKNAQ